MHKDDDLERFKEDITYKINVKYKQYWGYMGPLYFVLVTFGLLSFVYLALKEGPLPFLPIFLIILLFVIFLKYLHKKEIELVNNVYYDRFSINSVNQLGMKKQELNIPYKNSAFKLIKASEYYFTLYIANTFENVDLRELNVEGIPPKFFYIFHNINHYDEFQLERILEDRIKNNKLHFEYELMSNDKLKYYKTNNFLSYKMNNYINRYIVSICILIGLVYGITLKIMGDNNPKEKQNYITLIVFGIFILLFIMIISLVICSYLYRRIDIINKDNIIFIGITSFLRKSYSKKFIFEKDSIDEYKYVPNGGKKTLEFKLNDNNTQKIWDFKNNEKIDIISQQLNKYI